MYEIHTRRTTQEKEIQATTETIMKSETSTTDQDDISDAVKTENKEDTKIGLTVSAGVSSGVYHAEASANFGMEFSHTASQETAHKHMRQQSEKISSEIRKNYKTTFVPLFK